MDQIDRRLLMGAAGLAGLAAVSRLAQGGPLDPPTGPVAPTGRTLQEIYDRVARTESGVAEPRIPVQSLPGNDAASYVISEPGSYYLTGNILRSGEKDGIHVKARQVTLDLNGFTMDAGTGTAGAAIRSLAGQIAVRNGRLIAWGGGGFRCDDQYAGGCDLERMHFVASGPAVVAGHATKICDCVIEAGLTIGVDVGSDALLVRTIAVGVQGPAFRVGGGSILDGCVARGCNGRGFQIGGGSLLRGCVSTENRGIGFMGAFEDSLSRSVLEQCSSHGDLVGFAASDCELELCKATSSGVGMDGGGIGFTLNGSRAHRCGAYGCHDAGFALYGGAAYACHAHFCAGQAPQRANFVIEDFGSSGAGSVLSGCVSRGGHTGYRVQGAGGLLERCRCSGASVNAYTIAPGNTFGPIVNVAGAGDLSAVSGANHPLANFVF